MEPLHVPVDKLVKGDRLTGIVFRRTKVENGRVIEIEGSDFSVEAPLTISSIGSLPRPVAGIPMSGSVYQINKEECCRVEGYKNLFALGNAVTGRGNILESMKHGRAVSQSILEKWGVTEDGVKTLIENRESTISNQVDNVVEMLSRPLSNEKLATLENRIRTMQNSRGYEGDFQKWIEDHMPQRLEKKLGVNH